MSEINLYYYKIGYETLFTILITHSKLKCYNYTYTNLRKNIRLQAAEIHKTYILLLLRI